MRVVVADDSKGNIISVSATVSTSLELPVPSAVCHRLNLAPGADPSPPPKVIKDHDVGHGDRFHNLLTTVS